MKTTFSLRKLTVMGMMAALSVILVYLIRFPLLPAATFLEYEPADIPIFICTLLYGPLSGLALTLVVSVIQGFTVSASSGIIGIVMHLFATGSFVLVAGLIYRGRKTRSRAAIALGAGILVMTGSMLLWNILFTPIFLNTPRSAVMEMLVPIILPFNLLKAGINSLLAFVTYKKIGEYAIR